MAWTKSPETIIALFDSVVPDAPNVERRQMFGYPAAFVNGNLFMSLFQENMILRLGNEDRQQFLSTFKTKLFDPMGGRPMKEYAVVPAKVQKDSAILAEWICKAHAYGGSLPKKAKKPRKKPAAKKTKAG
jgi:TfoX/Sxy family transcriptional regulator of competence genes